MTSPTSIETPAQAKESKTKGSSGSATALETKTDVLGGQKNIVSVPLEHLRIDPRYQREHKTKRAEAIGRAWKDDQAGVIVVSKREDDTLWVVDGQHRVLGARIAGKSHLDAEIHEGWTLEREAELFDRLNQARNPVNSLERFRARLVYNEPEAVEIAAILDEFGSAIAEKTGRKNTGDTDVRAVTSIERVYNAGGPDLLREVLSLIQDAWGGIDYITTNEYTLGGLRVFLARHGDKADRARLVERLNTEGLGQIRRMAHAHGQIFGGSGPTNFYRAMVEAYNKHLTPRHRLRAQ